MAATDAGYECIVSGLARDTDREALQKKFASFGEITYLKVIKDSGIGFVTFSSEQARRNAVVGMNGRVFGGRTITVSRDLILPGGFLLGHGCCSVGHGGCSVSHGGCSGGGGVVRLIGLFLGLFLGLVGCLGILGCLVLSGGGSVGVGFGGGLAGGGGLGLGLVVGGGLGLGLGGGGGGFGLGLAGGLRLDGGVGGTVASLAGAVASVVATAAKAALKYVLRQ